MADVGSLAFKCVRSHHVWRLVRARAYKSENGCRGEKEEKKNKEPEPITPGLVFYTLIIPTAIIIIRYNTLLPETRRT